MQGLNVRRSMVPCVLSNLLVRVRQSQRSPRSNDNPLPSFSGDKSFGSFDSGNYRFDIEVGRQEIGIDDGRIEWIQAP